MLETFEIAVREVAFWSVLALGALCLIAMVLALAAWVMKKLLTTMGLYRNFLLFVRSRR